MKIRNIVQIVTLMGLATTGSVYSMWSNSLKKVACTVLQKAGTCLGYGLPMINPANNLYAQYSSYTNPEASVGPATREPNEAEAKYLRQFIDKRAKLKIVKFDGDFSSTDALTTPTCIFIPEFLMAPNKTLTAALNENDVEALNTFAGCAEHENKHFLEKHTLKVGAVGIIPPLATTFLASMGAKRMFPYKVSTSLLRHTGRFFAKTCGGFGLAAANGMTTAALQSKLMKKHELDADQNVNPKHRDAFSKELVVSYNFIANLPDSDVKKAIINQINFAYPDPNVRIAKLRQNDDTKQA